MVRHRRLVETGPQHGAANGEESCEEPQLRGSDPENKPSVVNHVNHMVGRF